MLLTDRIETEQILCLDSVLNDIICYTVVPVNVCFAVDDKPVVIRQLLAPALFVAVNRPVVTIVSAPKNGSSAFVQELF